MWELFKKKKKTKVQLVLGSGGARGLAHIGVIEMLEEEGYEIVEVVGCSMGAVIGGVYCAGHLEKYKEWLLTLNKSQIFRLMDFTLPNLGFLKGEKVLGKMRTFLGDLSIEDLPIPFVAVATDMVAGKEVHFRSGDLYPAIRASMSIPGVFTPIVQKDSLLVDGAVLNPLPMNVITKRRDTLVVAVNLNGLESPGEMPLPLVADEQTLAAATDLEKRSWWQKWRPLPTNLAHPDAASPGSKFSLIELMSNSYYLTQDKLVEMSIEKYKPDLVINVPRNACNIFDFHKGEHMIALGKKLYREAKIEAENH